MAVSWTPTGKATDRSTPYFGTSLPRLTHKLLYAIAYTTPDNRLIRLPAMWRNADNNSGERDVALDIGVARQQWNPIVTCRDDIRTPTSKPTRAPTVLMAEINGRLEWVKGLSDRCPSGHISRPSGWVAIYDHYDRRQYQRSVGCVWSQRVWPQRSDAGTFAVNVGHHPVWTNRRSRTN